MILRTSNHSTGTLRWRMISTNSRVDISSPWLTSSSVSAVEVARLAASDSMAIFSSMRPISSRITVGLSRRSIMALWMRRISSSRNTRRSVSLPSASSTNKLVTPAEAERTTRRTSGRDSTISALRFIASKSATLVPPNLATMTLPKGC
ncbi:hypothetical protein SRABI106_00876 [Rahnella aquatilis]|nr:hypothetical protein SRABI106_00876 [Rahnella aquatilis]